jgi:hypothetical protein
MIQHNAIFIVGPPRTGTSILFKCLEKSGYRVGTRLFGHKYKSQDFVFRDINREIYRLIVDLLNDRTSSAPLVINEPIIKKMREFWRYALLNRIDIFKDPLLYQIFGAYWNADESFRSQKFIWTHRDPLETAKSTVRLKCISNIPEKGACFTVGKHLKWLSGYNNIHETYRPQCDGIDVYFEDLLNNTRNVKEELSEFLGRPFDTSMISTKETYKEKGTPQ